ncbi:hypothetical protein [Burkholderia sp. AU45388]|uniref:hypothetical protein n=1 Tax=Burkholderia sp. AU45388 TaxID=3059206 RepID=UPI00264CBEA1|nr:hypothetical protein [Burkholderia sp. AU45388]MDN7425387.1 hypothetical protein [Burkholderia sp. AU45388]
MTRQILNSIARPLDRETCLRNGGSRVLRVAEWDGDAQYGLCIGVERPTIVSGAGAAFGQ